ncbi:hypothetical protein FSP39_011851 [Pinctada imbricata]|uniref:EF-hand domain-containing protein n=1 Tax=Pinctada imbricata TaxID=66713 RepID=A0AA88XM20_PINIB|nr:hypothetical protein FSP39_011851 [Pinctada imbricata]
MAVALSLVMCNTVSELHISGNSIGETGIKYITNMLKEDDNISVVDLSENDLQSYGANLVTSMIMENDNILSLRLSVYSFSVMNEFYSFFFQQRCVLRVLDLSHNEFGEAGGLLLGEAIGNNDSIETLDISWNRLGVAGARAIAKGLQENICLKHLNMSWNGIGDEGGKLIAESLVTSDTLLSLDLCCNRISHVGLVDVMKGVTACKTLRKLDVSRNPITFEGPVIALTILNEHLECGLNELVFVDMCVSGHFIPKLKEIRKQKPKFKVKHGGFLNGTDTIEHAWRQREENIMNDSMMKLLEYVHDKKLRWSDLFFQLDTDKSMSISEKEFIDGIKRAGIPLTDQQIRDLVERLDTDDDGEVDFG